MSKKKSKISLSLIIFLLGLIFVVGGGIGTYSVISNQPLSATSLNLDTNTVYEPRFTSLQCGVIEPDFSIDYDLSKRVDSNGWTKEYCSLGDHNVYTNRCELEIYRFSEKTVFSIASQVDQIFVCPINAKFENRLSECEKLASNKGTISYNPNQYILIHAYEPGFGVIEEGELLLRKVADRYGLIIEGSNNYLMNEDSCDISRIIETGYTYLTKDAEFKAPNGVLLFNQEMNYVSESSPTISKRVIIYEGKLVWTQGNREYCNIAKDVNGIRFVNLLDCKFAEDLICDPGSPLCSDDGTSFTDFGASGKTCNELFGSFLGQETPNPEDISEICKTRCGVDNELELYSCRDIPKCDANEVLSTNYKCVTVSVPDVEPPEEESSYLYLGLLAGGILLAGVSRKKAFEGEQNK